MFKPVCFAIVIGPGGLALQGTWLELGGGVSSAPALWEWGAVIKPARCFGDVLNLRTVAFSCGF